MSTKEQLETTIHLISKDLADDELMVLRLNPCLSMNELTSTIDIEPPSIEPLEKLLEKRTITIDDLRKSRRRLISYENL